MAGEVDLDTLLANLNPRLQPGRFVFCTHPTDLPLPVSPDKALMFFREAEAVTLVLEESVAVTRGFSYEQVFRQITLEVHSSLEAVGLTALFSAALADAGISANVVAGYFHDHVFVPAGQAARALEVLQAQQGAGGGVSPGSA